LLKEKIAKVVQQLAILRHSTQKFSYFPQMLHIPEHQDFKEILIKVYSHLHERDIPEIFKALCKFYKALNSKFNTILILC